MFFFGFTGAMPGTAFGAVVAFGFAVGAVAGSGALDAPESAEAAGDDTTGNGNGSAVGGKGTLAIGSADGTGAATRGGSSLGAPARAPT
jgi:hypothetical protein